jgi:hypothetical protein
MVYRKPIVYEIDEKGCHNVTSHAKTRDGYGQIKINNKAVLLHRYIYQLYYGQIPSGMLILHKCDNPRCINIDHLECGTHAENMRQKVERGRSGKGKVFHKQLTKEDVIKIREIGYSMKASDLAKLFNVHIHTIKDIRANRTWKRVGVIKIEE